MVDTLDAFLHSSAKICAEVRITIHHNLLASEPWEQIRTIYSKPEVFSQCRNWLAAMAKDRDVQPAAQHQQGGGAGGAAAEGVAAIGSTLAGELYGLRVAVREHRGQPGQRDAVLRDRPRGRAADRRRQDGDHVHHRPQAGALAEVLDVFKENGINLTDIEKRPSKKVNWEYYFFIDAQGHADDPGMQKAIEEARQHCLQLTVLGSYPRAQEVLLAGH